MSRYFQTTALVASLAATAYAHGRVTSITADGTEYEGFLTDYIYTDVPADLVAWSADNADNGFVDPSSYSSAADIACHKSGAPGGGAATVAAGSTVSIQWGPDVWPESHHGPVLDYLAHCAGDDCSSVSAADLSFFKIAEGGLNDGSSAPGHWASDDIIDNNGLWEVTIPESLAPGQYVLRHEIIALHSAGDPNGAQNYPQCFNLEVTGSGSASPEGVTADQLYTADEAGITASIYTAPIEYTIPGPALWDGASSGGSGPGNGGSSPPSTGGSSSAAAPAPTSAPATSAPATSAPAAPPAYTPQVPSSSAPYGSPNGTLPAPTGTGTAAPTGISTSYVATTSAPAQTSSYGSPTTAAPQPPAYTSDVQVDPVTESATSSAPAATSAATAPSAPAYGGGEEETSPAPGGSYGGGSSDKPSMADLLEWIEYYVKKGYEADSGRVHARDMRRRL